MAIKLTNHKNTAYLSANRQHNNSRQIKEMQRNCKKTETFHYYTNLIPRTKCRKRIHPIALKDKKH